MTAAITQPMVTRSTSLSAAARLRMQAAEPTPLLRSDWTRALFMHYEMDPAALAPLVPFDLDLREGKAYVSLVAFSMRRMRPHFGGVVTQLLSRPLANHAFLNVRTYVMRDGEPGIFFLAEWLPNALSVWLGPRAFGLPYRLGRLSYQHEHELGRLSGDVEAGAAHLRYSATVDRAAAYQPCEAGSLDEFLLERYTAYTERGGVYRRFRIWHEPWPAAPANVAIHDAGLLDQTGIWRHAARCIGGHYSPGVSEVELGRPMCINGAHCGRHWRGQP